MNPVYCNRCGTPNVEGASFCAKCGGAIRILSDEDARMSPVGAVAPAPSGTMVRGATSAGQSTGRATSSASHLAGTKRDESAAAKRATTVETIPKRTKALVVILLTLVLVGASPLARIDPGLLVKMGPLPKLAAQFAE